SRACACTQRRYPIRVQRVCHNTLPWLKNRCKSILRSLTSFCRDVAREWVLRHLFAYLICSQKSYPILLKHFHRLREVCFRISHCIGPSGHLHSLCGNIHFVDCVKKAARSRKEHLMGLLRRNKKSMGDVTGK